MGRPSFLLLIPLLLALSMGSHSALARCFGVPEGPTELGEGWRLHLTAQAEGVEDGVDLGVFEGASVNLEPGLDAIERFAEVKPFYLYFLYPFPDVGFNYFDTSIVGVSNRLYFPLTLDVRVERTLMITINWSAEEMANIPSDWILTLVDPRLNTVNMRDVTAMTLALGLGVYDMRVDVDRVAGAELGSTEVLVLALAAYGAGVLILLFLRRRARRRGGQPPR